MIQDSRMNDQRADLSVFPGLRLSTSNSSTVATLDSIRPMISGRSVSTSDQSLSNLSVAQQSVQEITLNESGNPLSNSIFQDQATNKRPDFALVDMIMSYQRSTRLDDQRAVLPLSEQPQTTGSNVDTAQSNTIQTLPRSIPNPTYSNEDFFELIERYQSSRLEEQRCDVTRYNMVPVGTSYNNANGSNLTTTSNCNPTTTAAPNTSTSSTSSQRNGFRHKFKDSGKKKN